MKETHAAAFVWDCTNSHMQMKLSYYTMYQTVMHKKFAIFNIWHKFGVIRKQFFTREFLDEIKNGKVAVITFINK